MPRATRSVEERFWVKVRAEDDCLMWTGALDPLGNGRFRFEGKSALAHRVAWVLFHGAEPEGFLHHTCPHSACVNPNHLEVREAPGPRPRELHDFVDVRSYDECWEWQGNRSTSGYGLVKYEGRRQRAHRAVFSLFVHSIEDDEIIMHICDNPPCCNPLHLRLGTQAENMADMASKGRTRNQYLADRLGRVSPGHGVSM